jgi:acyl-CoA reductase-like NAD-dependent aldehyde dehydrogenase
MFMLMYTMRFSKRCKPNFLGNIAPSLERLFLTPCRYKLGDPFNPSTNIGPVISRAAQKNIVAQIDDALAKGAKDITPANATFTSTPAEGNYVVPRILIDVTHDMAVMSEETFGPVLPIMKVSSDAEAITLMNDSDYGLTASVWTKDIAKGEELISQLEAGTVFVNRCDYPNPVCIFLMD